MCHKSHFVIIVFLNDMIDKSHSDLHNNNIHFRVIMMSCSISLQTNCITTVHGQCPLLYGEVTEDIPEANVIVKMINRRASCVLMERKPRGQENTIRFD